MSDRLIERAILTCEVKEAGDGADRVLVFDGSTEAIDRMDEVISADGWELANYKKNPVFMWAHNYGMPPIGRSIRTWVDKTVKRLKFKIEFADAETYPFADTVYRLYKGGFMKAVSVGFIPIETEQRKDDDKPKRNEPRRRYLRQELLELSAAPVPANPEALQNAVTAGIVSTKDIAEFEGVVTLAGLEAETERLHKAAGDIGAIVGIQADGQPCFGEPAGTVAPQMPVTGLEDGDVSDTIDVLTPSDEDDDILSMASLDEMLDILEGEPHTKPEENDEYIRIPAKGEEGKHKGHAIRWIEVSKKEGIKGIYCIDCKKIITYVFLKDHGWTMEKAKKWVEDHSKGVTVEGLWNTHIRAAISQEALIDEIEYLTTQLDEVGISEEASPLAWELVRTILRLTGGDTPDDIAKALAPPAVDFGKEATGAIMEGVRAGLRQVFNLPNKQRGFN